jgi:hypothetical protein
MRQDIQTAYNRLDPKGRGSIDGFRSQGSIKKAYQQLAQFLPDEKVLAIAGGADPPPSVGEQRGMGGAAALGAIAEAGRSGRLLVLTEMNLYEVRGTGRLNGNKPEGIRYPLADITDIRVLANRSIGRGLGAKQRYLTFDYMRGVQIETRQHVMGSDSELETFSRALTDQVQLVAEAVAEQERQDRGPAVAQLSVADELAKLKSLMESGVLSEAEFAQQKAKLLST